MSERYIPEDDKNPLLQHMRKDSPLYRTLSVSGQEQAKKAARALQGFLDLKAREAVKSFSGCKQCTERLAKPHSISDPADLPPLIDSSKLI